MSHSCATGVARSAAAPSTKLKGLTTTFLETAVFWEKERPLPCKPDSVPPAFAGFDDHFSSRRSGSPPKWTATNTRRFSGRATLLLFCLAPRGVYRATVVAFGAVGSYPTFSPLPRRIGAVCFLLHFPSRLLAETCPSFSRGTLPCGVRTFLDPFPKEETAIARGAAGATVVSGQGKCQA